MASVVGKRVWNIALFGAPGGGKGTISNKMLKEFSFFNHVSLAVVEVELEHSKHASRFLLVTC